MNDSNYKEILAMLAVIYKKLDELALKADGGRWNTDGNQSYFNKLRKEASEITVR
jgi:hypothetical protein